jgi:hypothetical protein
MKVANPDANLESTKQNVVVGRTELQLLILEVKDSNLSPGITIPI